MIQDGAMEGVDKVIALHVISNYESGKVFFHDGPSLNITIVNTGTFVGAICFLVGAYVLLPPGHAANGRWPGSASPRSQSCS